MKLKFIEAPHGRHYKIGEIHDFVGPVAETYARKFLARGWAVEHKDAPVAPVVAEKPPVAKPSTATAAKPTLELPQQRK